MKIKEEHFIIFFKKLWHNNFYNLKYTVNILFLLNFFSLLIYWDQFKNSLHMHIYPFYFRISSLIKSIHGFKSIYPYKLFFNETNFIIFFIICRSFFFY